MRSKSLEVDVTLYAKIKSLVGSGGLMKTIHTWKNGSAAITITKAEKTS